MGLRSFAYMAELVYALGLKLRSMRVRIPLYAPMEEFEFEVELNEGKWFVGWRFEGNEAIGHGPSVWQAIENCLTEGFARAITLRDAFRTLLDQAKAGIARCPGCDELRPRLTPEMLSWAPFCDACRGDDD